MNNTQTQWSDYIVYVDESGDHSLTSINPDYPVFVLAFCIFHKKYYAESIVPAFTKFKFDHFGHDIMVLHEHDIRKETNGFNFQDRAGKLGFLTELSELIKQQNFIIVGVVIDKNKLIDKYQLPDNPYHIALKFCLERLSFFLQEKNQHSRFTPVIFENRGKKEDNELELEFRRLCDNQNFNFYMKFADKKTNSTGLQLADLVARPIGLKTIRPDQTNQAFVVVEEKLYSKNGRQGAGSGYEGYGLKCFP